MRSPLPSIKFQDDVGIGGDLQFQALGSELIKLSGIVSTHTEPGGCNRRERTRRTEVIRLHVYSQVY